MSRSTAYEDPIATSAARPRPPLIVEPEGASAEKDRAAVRALAECGARLRPLLDCLGQFHGELLQELEGLAVAGLDADARRRLRNARELAAWSAGVGGDLLGEVVRAQAGWCPVDLVGRLRHLARELADEGRTELRLDHRGGRLVCWGNPVAIRAALRDAVEWCAARSLGAGPVSVTAAVARRSLCLRFRSTGPCAVRAASAVDLRELSGAVGWRVESARVGPRGAVLVLRAPA